MRLRHIEVFPRGDAAAPSAAQRSAHILAASSRPRCCSTGTATGPRCWSAVRGKLYPRPEARRLFARDPKSSRATSPACRHLAASLKHKWVGSQPGWWPRPRWPSACCRRRWPPGAPIFRARSELGAHTPDEIVNILGIGEADLGAVAAGARRHPSIVAEPLAEGPLVALGRAGTWPAWRLAASRSRSARCPEDLIGLPGRRPAGRVDARAFEAADREPGTRGGARPPGLGTLAGRGRRRRGGGRPLQRRAAGTRAAEERPTDHAELLPVRLLCLSASQAPLYAHGARELVQCVAAVARRSLDAGWR